MRQSAILWAAFTVLIPAAAIPAAELKLAAIFSDHMVLQRGKPVPVWGWADPGEQITVEFAGQKKQVAADDTGKWKVTIDRLEASSSPRQLVVTSERPQRTRAVTDVLVGEVWLGSGQSNMAMTVSRAKDFETEHANADWPQIRMFTERSGAAAVPQPDGTGTWAVCSSQTVGTYSATLYFFGRELHRKLQVPIGLINSSVGGTPIEAWIAAEAQAQTPELRTTYEAAQQAFANFDVARAQAQFEKSLARWKDQVAAAKKAGKTAPRRPVNPVDQHNRRGGPGGLFYGKIAPLIPYALRGVVWYQGEANSQPGKGHLYQYQLPLLVRDWRQRWGEELPFAWVQLPNFRRDGEGWMLVREAMLKTLRLPNTGMAITVDIGESGDIHPKNKQDVGRRLAFWALGTVYEKLDVATSGPLPAGYTINGASIACSFTHTHGGLRTSGGEVKGFALAGEDRVWHPATAVIVADKVLVSHPNIRQPVAVRYAWSADPDCNLMNGAGLPASPFRTDDWPTSDGP